MYEFFMDTVDLRPLGHVVPSGYFYMGYLVIVLN